MLNRLHGGDIRAHTGSGAARVVDFSANINPLGYPACVEAVLAKSAGKIIHYPEHDAGSLTEALARHHAVSARNIVAGNGSIELIYLIPKALGLKKVLIITPTFSEYETASRIHGARTVFLRLGPKNDFKPDIDRVIRALDDVDGIFLCNPNNPTGTAFSRDELTRIWSACGERDVTMVVDEAFIDFRPDGARKSLVRNAVKSPGLVVLRSLTKIYALAGLRAGYIVAHKDTAGHISRYQYPWSVNSLASEVGKAVLRDRAYMKKTHQTVAREAAYMYRHLGAIEDIMVYRTDANFFLCRLKKTAVVSSASVLKKRLLARGIIVRDCSNFRGLDRSYFRVAVKRREDNSKLLSALRHVLEAAKRRQ
ncbi:MAG: threonine-phosphate decarboxylase CobD [Candidatus Omnitrophota bacterium]